MKKQVYIDMGLSSGLSLKQIENVICQILGITKSQFFLLQEISSRFMYEIQHKFYTIKNGVPEEYILGNANFYARDFYVDARVLIPRNDTEVLVKEVLQYILKEGNASNTVYTDVGTGSACIPVSIILEVHPLKFTQSFALDISIGALEVAKKNIENHKVSSLILRESNLLEALYEEDVLTGKNLCITANLPYIRERDSENMDVSVFTHEPAGALYGGKITGFELYEKLIMQCFQFQEIFQLRKIDLFIEIGFDQYEVSKNFLENLGLSFEYFKDSAKIRRVVHIHGFNNSLGV